METAIVFPIAVTLGAVVFATLVFLTLFRHMTPQTVISDYSCCNGGWHEAVLADCATTLVRVPQQPVNTYSNLAYLAAGLLIQFTLGTDTAFVFAVTMTYLCIGSALYHATSTRWAGVLDITAIFAVFPSIAVYAAAGLFGVGNHELTPLAMFLVAGGLVYALSRRAARYMRAVIAVSLGTAYLLLLAYMVRTGDWRALPYLLSSLGLFVLAFWSWGLDKKQKFPLKAWGHGVWHVATAAASALVFYAVHLTQKAPPL